jgi:hypothetical protein
LNSAAIIFTTRQAVQTLSEAAMTVKKIPLACWVEDGPTWNLSKSEQVEIKKYLPSGSAIFTEKIPEDHGINLSFMIMKTPSGMSNKPNINKVIIILTPFKASSLSSWNFPY